MTNVDPTNQTPPTNPDPNTPDARNPDGSLKDQPVNPDPNLEKPEEKKPEDKPAEKPAVPEAYTFKAPEGYEVDPKIVEEVTPVFKELGLSNDQAQKLIDIWNKHSTAAAEAPLKFYEETRNKWRNEIISDKDLGDGKDNMKPEVRAAIAKTIDMLPGDLPKSFREAMDTTGAGDNPAFVRALMHFSKFLTEGKAPPQGSPTTVKKPGEGPKSIASSMFPELPSAS